MTNQLSVFAQYDNLLMAEVNVKAIRRYVCSTERGELYLDYDGSKYLFTIDGVDVTTNKLMSIAESVLNKSFEDYKAVV